MNRTAETSFADAELVELFADEPELLAIADAVAATTTTPARAHASANAPSRLRLPRPSRLLAEITDDQRQPRRLLSQLIAPRRRLAALAIALGLLVIGTAVAATTGWLTGSPAPPSVVADFGSYTPQLGFHPDSGSSVFVAEAGDSQLYATTNAEGSYCVVASAPWKRPNQNPDGGSCVGEKTAVQRVVAGIVGGSPTDSSRDLTLLVAGRISVPGAASVNVTLPDHSIRNVKLGSSGFFLTNVETQLCQGGDWIAKLVALDPQGRQLAQSTITLEHSINPSGTHGASFAVCQLPPLTSEAAPAGHVGP